MSAGLVVQVDLLLVRRRPQTVVAADDAEALGGKAAVQDQRGHVAAEVFVILCNLKGYVKYSRCAANLWKRRPLRRSGLELVALNQEYGPINEGQ